MMDAVAAGVGGIKIDQLTETNFHERRQRIKMVLALRDVEDMLDEDGKPEEHKVQELALWKRRDTKASAIIGLTLGSEQLEHVSGCKSTAEMWSTLQGVFQRKSLMNKMKARREFYTVAMGGSEAMLSYINRVRNLGENLKAICGEVTEMYVAMSVLNGLTSKYENLLVALDAKSEEELSLDFFKSRLLQEERRQADKNVFNKRSGDTALVGANSRTIVRRGDYSKVECYYCHKLGHVARECPVLKAKNNVRDNMAAVVAEDSSDSDDAVCLVGNAHVKDISKSWLVDSAASPHMCWMRDWFDDYRTTSGRRVTMGDKGSVATAGVGTVTLSALIQGKTRKIKLAKVLHVPSMGFHLVSVGNMEECGAEVSFLGGKAVIRVDGKDVARATRRCGLYHVDMVPRVNVAAVASLQPTTTRAGRTWCS